MHATRTTLVALLAMALSTAQALPVVQMTLPLGNNTQGIATDPVLARVYITNFNDGTGTVIKVNTLSLDETVAIGANPRRLIADAARHRVYVVMATTPGTLLVADSAGDDGIVYVPVGNNPRSLGANLPLGEIYVSNLDSNSVSVVSTTTNSVIATIPVGTAPVAPASNDILRKLYVPSTIDSTVSVIDETTHTVIKTIPVGNAPSNAAVDAQHGKVYVNNVLDKTVSVIDSATDTVIKTVPTGAGIGANIGHINAVYRRYYLPNATDGTLTIISTDTDTVVKTVTVGTSPTEALVDASGGDVYVVNQGSNSVTVINAATETAIGNFTVGGAPWRMADSLGHLFILNTNGGAPDSLTIASENNSIANTAIASEYYHKVFNHYFHTATEIETRVLIDGIFHEDWFRTFEFFRVWTTAGPGRFPVSRFFSTQWGTKSSHFFTANQSERDKLVAGIIPGWQLEADALYYIGLPDATGSCAAGTVPLYRLYNDGQGGAPNHRLTGNRATRDQMRADGWVAEGSGPDTVYACLPSLLSG